jgi:hypothetical protein
MHTLFLEVNSIFQFITLDFIYSVYPCPAETIRGYFITVVFLLCLPFVLLRQKGGVFFILDRECIFKPIK